MNKKVIILLVMGILSGGGAIAAALMTQKLSGPMAIADHWTLLLATLAAVSVAVAVTVFRARD